MQKKPVGKGIGRSPSAIVGFVTNDNNLNGTMHSWPALQLLVTLVPPKAGTRQQRPTLRRNTGKGEEI